MKGPAEAGSEISSLTTRGQRSAARAGLPQHQVGVLRMFLDVCGDGRADYVDLDAIFAGPVERRFGEFRRDAAAAQRFRDFAMNELEHLARQVVLKIGDVAVLLDFKPAVGDLLCPFSRK